MKIKVDICKKSLRDLDFGHSTLDSDPRPKSRIEVSGQNAPGPIKTLLLSL